MSGVIRCMHFADTHFGVETYGRLDPATGLNTRLLDFRNSLCRAIESALQEGVHLALFAGDAYKSRDPSQTHQREFALCIRRLTEAGVPVAIRCRLRAPGPGRPRSSLGTCCAPPRAR